MRNEILIILAILSFSLSHAQVGIGTDTPDGSSALDVTSNSQGVLIPRLTEAQRDLIANPAEGLMIYQTDNDFGFYFFDGVNWVTLASGSAWGLEGNSGTDASVNFIGTTTNEDLVFRTDGVEAARVITDGSVAIGTTVTNSLVQVGEEPNPPALESGTILLYENFNDGVLDPAFTTNNNWVFTSSFANSAPFGITTNVGDDVNSGTAAGFTVPTLPSRLRINNFVVPPGPDAVLTFSYRTLFNPKLSITDFIRNAARFEARIIAGPDDGIVPDVIVSLKPETDGFITFTTTLPAGNTFRFDWLHTNFNGFGVGIPALYVLDDVTIRVQDDFPPTTPLMRIVDGSEALGNVIVSDNDGNATWDDPTINPGFIEDEDWGFLSGNSSTDPIYRLLSTDFTDDNRPSSVRIGSITQVDGIPSQLLHIQEEGNVQLTEVGIGSNEFIQDGVAEFRFSHSVEPVTDNTISSGSSTNRWDQVFSANGVINTSDINEKENIKPLDYDVESLLQIKPITYQWNKDHYREANIPKNILERQKIGFSAQNLREVIPEVVVDHSWQISPETKEWSKNKNELAGVYYNELLPLIVNSIKEKDTLLEEIKKEQKEIKELLKKY